MYHNQGRWEEAEKLQVDVVDSFKERLGMDHPSTLNSMAHLASTYCTTIRKNGMKLRSCR